MAIVETELIEEISSELLLVKAENTQLLELIATKDSVIHKLTQESKTEKLRIRALKLLYKKFFDRSKGLEGKLAQVRDYVNAPLVKKIVRERER